MTIRFLLDENIDPRLRVAVHQFEPQIDILRVGDKHAPTLGTLDPVILAYIQREKRILVTDNRASMPQHIADHLAEGGHHYGLIWVRPTFTIGEYAEALYIIWAASTADEWINRLDWIPF